MFKLQAENHELENRSRISQADSTNDQLNKP